MELAGLAGVTVERRSGWGANQYDPSRRTVYLSPAAYSGATGADRARAAQAAGYALQHQQAPRAAFWRRRLRLLTELGSNAGPLAALCGFLISNRGVLLSGACLFALAVLTSLAVLPLERDAARRAGHGAQAPSVWRQLAGPLGTVWHMLTLLATRPAGQRPRQRVIHG